MSEHRHPCPIPEHFVGPPPPDGGVYPMPRRRSHECIEPAAPWIPGLEGGGLHPHVREVGQALACQVSQTCARFDRHDRATNWGQGPRRLSRATADLDDRGLSVDARDGQKICHELGRVRRTDPVVQRRVFVEDPTEVSATLVPHIPILTPSPPQPHRVPDRAQVCTSDTAPVRDDVLEHPPAASSTGTLRAGAQVRGDRDSVPVERLVSNRQVPARSDPRPAARQSVRRGAVRAAEVASAGRDPTRPDLVRARRWHHVRRVW